MLAHVVHAQDRRAALVRGDRGRDARAERAGRRRADRRRACRASSCARSRSAPAGRARAARRAGAAARRCARPSCRTRCPGRGRCAPRARPARRRTRGAPRETPPPPPRRRRSADPTCIVRGSPCMCMRQTYASCVGDDTSASCGSPRNAVTSFTISAPSSSARRATSAFAVSIETGTSPCEPLEHRHDAAQLLVERHAVRAGPRRLAADVDDRRALREHPPRRSGRDVRVEVHAAVGERVGRHVDDAHHGRARKPFLDRNHARAT